MAFVFLVIDFSILLVLGVKSSFVSTIIGFMLANLIIPSYGPKNGAKTITSPIPRFFFPIISKARDNEFEVPPGVTTILSSLKSIYGIL